MLNARVVSWEDSPKGPQAWVMLVEDNGDEHFVRCQCRGEHTDVGTMDPECWTYLVDRYGTDRMLGLVRRAMSE